MWWMKCLQLRWACLLITKYAKVPPPTSPADVPFWVMTVGLSLNYTDSVWQGILSHLKRLLPLKSQVCSSSCSHPQIAGDLRQTRVTLFFLFFSFFVRQIKKQVRELGDAPILQGVLVPSAGGSGGNSSLRAPSSVPASSLSCQTGIPPSTRLHLRRTGDGEREACSLISGWLWFFPFFPHLPDSDVRRKTCAAWHVV